MKILIDIKHPAQLNFFKNIATSLKENGHCVDISYLNRGKLKKIIHKEYVNYSLIKIGRHRGTKLSIIFEANIFRFFRFFQLLIFKRYSVCISVANFNLGFASKILRIPNIQITDDIERKFLFKLLKLSSTKLILPIFAQKKGHIDKFNALKEWAYLSPKYFIPDLKVLEEYNLIAKEYIFVREVSTGSLNYKNQKEGTILSIANKLNKNIKVILSLEDKKSKHLYPKNWIILEEPVKDIHSLIYFSKFVISSGDSMAREAGMLGVPGIYCGIRDMQANEILTEKGILFKIQSENVPDFVETIFQNKINIPEQNEFRKKLVNEWDDVTEFILNEIYKALKK